MKIGLALWMTVCIGCSGAQVAPAGAYSVSGSYHGPTDLRMEVSSPVSRRLPDETGQGVATFSDAGNGSMMLTVQLRAGGQRCTLTGDVSGSRFTVHAGQRCTAALEYDEVPIDAQVEISQGYADFVGSTVSVSLGGAFEATSLVNGRNFEGVALWRLQRVR